MEKRAPLEEEKGVIRPAAFTKKAATGEKRRKAEMWTDEDRVAASNSFKDQYIEEVSVSAAEAVLRVFASAGLLDLDKHDVPNFLMMFESIKAVGCKSMGVEHPFHAVCQKVIQEPDDKTRALVGYMIMSAEGSLPSKRDCTNNPPDEGA